MKGGREKRGYGKEGMEKNVPTAAHRVGEIPAGGVVGEVEAFAGEGGVEEGQEEGEEEEVEKHCVGGWLVD